MSNAVLARSRKNRRRLPFAVLTLVALSCRGSEPAVEPLPRQRFQDVRGAVQPYLTTWRLIGPIPWDPGSAAPTQTDLRPILDAPSASWESALVSDPSHLPSVDRRSIRTVKQVNGEVKLHTTFARYEYQTAFAVTDVVSSVEGDAALLIEADDAVRVWLNGVSVHTSSEVRRLQQFEDYVPVRLRKGTNRLLLKLARAGSRGGSWDSWSFAVGLRSLRGAREERAARTLLQEVLTSLVGNDDLLAIDLRLHPATEKVAIVINDQKGKPVRQLRLQGGERHLVNVRDLPDGLYHSQVSQSAAPQLSPFYKGQVQGAFRKLLAQTTGLRSDLTHAANLTALEERFAHLFKAEHRENQNHLWQAKVVHLVAELTSIREAMIAGRPPFQDTPGTHLRGIRSRIDGANQYYILHIPHGYRRANGPLPLVLIQPYKFETLRPFLQSIPVAEISVLGMLGRIADEAGVAFLWMDNRGNTYGSDFGETDMFDAVEQVARDYAIDRDRLYLFGSCAGGREAMSLAAKYPDRFAAVGTMSPTSSYRPYAPETPTDRFGDVAYRQKTPLVRMENLIHVPVYAFHGDENTHNPLSESLQLKEAAERAGVDFNLDVVPGATHLRFPVEPRSLIFRWFTGRRRVVNPDRVLLTTSAMRYHRAHWLEIERITDPTSEARIDARFEAGELVVDAKNVAAYRLLAGPLRERTGQLTVRTNGAISFAGSLAGRSDVRVTVTAERGHPGRPGKNPNVGGPVWDVFSAPFMVVIGTGGDALSAQAAHVDAQRLSQSWRERFLGSLMLRTDREVTRSDILDRHLILFGQAHSGSRLASATAHLPFRVVGRDLRGPRTGSYAEPTAAQFLVPNPLNQRRYLLVILNPRGIPMPVDAVQLALKGWYDYSVWSTGAGGQAALRDIGMFDSSWSRLVSKMPPIAGAARLP